MTYKKKMIKNIQKIFQMKNRGCNKKALFVVFCLTFINPNAWAEPGSSKEKRIHRGEAAYRKYCQICHGRSGTGDGPGAEISGIPPRDLTDKAYMSLLSDSDLVQRIKYGEDHFPYLQMPGFDMQVSTQTIWAIIAYIRTLEVDKGPFKGPTPEERARRFKNPMERGRVYYQRYCSPCHGITGDGKGNLAATSGGIPVAHSDPKIMGQYTRQMIFAHVKGLKKKKDRKMLVFGKFFTKKIVQDIAIFTKTLSK